MFFGTAGQVGAAADADAGDGAADGGGEQTRERDRKVRNPHSPVAKREHSAQCARNPQSPTADAHTPCAEAEGATLRHERMRCLGVVWILAFDFEEWPEHTCLFNRMSHPFFFFFFFFSLEFHGF